MARSRTAGVPSLIGALSRTLEWIPFYVLPAHLSKSSSTVRAPGAHRAEAGTSAHAAPDEGQIVGNLDRSNFKTGKVPKVQIGLCLRVSNVDGVNRDRTSGINPERADSDWIHFLVSNYL